MKVDIWIYTDEGVEYRAENLNWSEACAIIVDKHNQEELFNLLNNEVMKDYIKDVANEINGN
jgi:uncharacterized membrane protein